MPSPNQPEGKAQGPFVVICADLGDEPAPLAVSELAEALGSKLPGAKVSVAAWVCESEKALTDVLGDAHPQRVVLGCRAGARARGDLLASLRNAGVPAAGADIVDLRAGRECSRDAALVESEALLGAAAARVAAADLETPSKERVSFSVGGMSRRSLFRGVGRARRPIATLREERCGRSVSCTVCLLSCRHGALRQEGGRLVVDGDRCTACGACVLACHRGALSLAGADLGALGAAAGVLVESIERDTPANGVAVTCQDAAAGPLLGEGWLSLKVPSLEMVSVGWLLQFLSRGVGVRLVGCGEKECTERGANLRAFVEELAGALGRPVGGLLSTTGATGPDETAGLPLKAAICLAEPDATVDALRSLGALDPDCPPWRAGGPGCPLGTVTVESTGCSLCGACVSVCPTGALSTHRDGTGPLGLFLDPLCCTACGVCVLTCPEHVISLEKQLGSESMTAGKQALAIAPVSQALCESCGIPLPTVLSASALSRLGAYSFLAEAADRVCANCRLRGRSVAARQGT